MQVQIQIWLYHNICILPYDNMCHNNMHHSLFYFMTHGEISSHISSLSIMFDCSIQSWVSSIFSIITSMTLLNYYIFFYSHSHVCFWTIFCTCQLSGSQFFSDKKLVFDWTFVFLYSMCHFSLAAFKVLLFLYLLSLAVWLMYLEAFVGTYSA